MAQHGQPIAVSLSGVAKSYESRRAGVVTAASDITLEVAESEFVSIVGPSGCGKTTVLKMIAGLLAPTEGRIELRGVPVNGPSPDIGVMFQSPVLLPWRTVLRNVLLPAEVAGRQQGKLRDYAKELLSIVGLDGFEKAYPNELSGGMQQRIAIVRALLLDPSVLLMDEPFGALDAITRDRMGLLLLRVWERTRQTVVFITHSIPEAVLLSDRVVVMSRRPGRIALIEDIGLPRPRGGSDLSSPQFVAIVARIRAALEDIDQDDIDQDEHAGSGAR